MVSGLHEKSQPPKLNPGLPEFEGSLAISHRATQGGYAKNSPGFAF